MKMQRIKKKNQNSSSSKNLTIGAKYQKRDRVCIQSSVKSAKLTAGISLLKTDSQ